VREEIVKIPNHIFGKFFLQKKKERKKELGPAQPILGWAYKAGLSPATWAGLMFQPTSQVSTVTSKKMKIIR